MDITVEQDLCTVKIGVDYSDFEFSTKLKQLCNAIWAIEGPPKVLLDLERTEWQDPLAILSTAGVLREYVNSGGTLRISLGQAKSTIKHRGHLKFLSKQGFLSLFSEFCDFIWNGKLYVGGEKRELITGLADFLEPVNYGNADCIFARLVCLEQFLDDSHNRNLNTLVESLVAEANDRLIDRAYGGDPLIRDRLLQKIRKIFLELLSNAAEHAYTNRTIRGVPAKGYAGIYARMRAGRPSDPVAARVWQHCWGRERMLQKCPGMQTFYPNVFAPWVEVFFNDVGIGLLTEIHRWRSPTNNANVSSAISRLQKSTWRSNRLQILSKILFKEPFSSIDPRSTGRTSITGLLHLGLMLQQDGDYGRIYANGEWAGSRYPWEERLGGSYVNVTKLMKYPDPSMCAPGTAYAFAIQPIQIDVQYDEARWVVPGDARRKHLINELQNPPLDGIPAGILLMDRREDPHCALPDEWWVKTEAFEDQGILQNTPTIVLRPPRSVNKRQLAAWVERVVGMSAYSKDLATTPRLVIAELTPFQAVTYAELFSRDPWMLHKAERSVQILFVSEDWAVCCLEKQAGWEMPTVKLAAATEFISLSSKESWNSAAGLLRILRYADSKHFWHQIISDTGSAKHLFIRKRIAWPGSQPRSDGVEPHLTAYLDLAQALVDPSRYRACRRALRRCLNLFPDLDILPSDELVRSLANDAERGRLRPSRSVEDGTSKKLVLGSVRVTSRTVDRFFERADVPQGSQKLFVFANPTANIGPTTNAMTALDWLPETEKTTVSDDEDLRRIPGTSHFGRGGIKALAIPRFHRPEPGSQELTNPIYGRSPAQTYGDFNRLGALKFGHWAYSKAHDLLTINLARAYELSVLDNGPLLSWLLEKLRSLCVNPITKTPHAVLLYPSNRLTDQIISLMMEQSFSDERGDSLRLGDFVFAISFITPNTVSPLRISPLLYDNLKEGIGKTRDANGITRAVIFDDGSVSGKTLNEVTQIAHDLGAANVQSVVILDRSGIPIYLNHCEDQARLQHVFWRWDVPQLGRPRDCPLCAALGRVSAVRLRMKSGAIAHRLKQWEEIWRSVSVADSWESGGLEPVRLGQDVEVDGHRFGIYSDGAGTAAHTIVHATSTSIAAGIIEITRSTTDADYALRKIEKLEATYGPSCGVEVLVAQTFLFFDELTYWQKIDRFRKLLTILWLSEEDTSRTSLIGLALALVEDGLLEDVWGWFRKTLLRQHRVKTVDAHIAADMLRRRHEGLAGKSDIISSTPTSEELFNYTLMFSDGSRKRLLATIFQLIGANDRGIHNMGLSVCLAELKDGSAQRSHERTVRKIKEVSNYLTSLAEALELLGELPFPWPDVDFRPRSDAQSIRAYVLGAPAVEPGHGPVDFVGVERWRTEVGDFLFGGRRSVAGRYRAQYVRVPSTGNATSAIAVPQARQRLSASWQEIVRGKIAAQQRIAQRWTIERKDIEPSIQVADDRTWPREIEPIVFDRYIDQCIYEVLSNCIHVDEEISNPWKTNVTSDAVPIVGTMWYRVLVVRKGIEIQFANFCSSESFVLRPTPARSELERIGGEVNSVVVERGRHGLVIRGPSTGVEILGMEELVGVTSGQRIAVTRVCVPFVSSLREELEWSTRY